MSAGRFVWRELVCKTPAVDFYHQLFGWTAAPVEMGGMTYTLFKRASGEDVAGSMAPQMEGVPPHWFDYITVDDLDVAAATITRLGGKVLSPQINAPGVGRWFVAQDPAGATFAPFIGENPGATPDGRPPVHTFCWSQRVTGGLDQMVSFYNAVFGWSAAPMGPSAVLSTPDGVQRAAIVPLPTDMPAPEHWLAYVAVEDVDASTARAQALGATVLAPPQDRGTIGRFSILRDPAGAALALWKHFT